MRFKSTRALLVLVAVFAMSAVAASSAWAAGKPLVETKPATAITKSEATLNGVVNPNGAETRYHFEYGTSISYGSSTAEVYVGSGTSNREVLAKVAGLLADKAYDFRIVATNSFGTTDGANETFTTSGPKVPLAETVGASAITETGATLNGVVNPNGVETKYHFQYGTTVSYGKETTAVSAGAGTANLNESAAIASLTAKTTYHYRIVATNANGTTDGPDGTFYSEVGPEFKPFPTKRKFTSAGGSLSVWVGAAGATLQCSASSSTGEVTGGKTLGNIVITWTGCKVAPSGEAECSASSEGAKEGEIVTKTLGGELGTVATGEAASGVGLLVKPTKNSEWLTFAGSKCLEEGVLSGSAASYVGPLHTKKTTYELPYSAEIKEIKLGSGTVTKPRLSYGAGSFEILGAFTMPGKTTFEEELEIT
jgi:hypothetical protein